MWMVFLHRVLLYPGRPWCSPLPLLPLVPLLALAIRCCGVLIFMSRHQGRSWGYNGPIIPWASQECVQPLSCLIELHPAPLLLWMNGLLCVVARMQNMEGWVICTAEHVRGTSRIVDFHLPTCSGDFWEPLPFRVLNESTKMGPLLCKNKIKKITYKCKVTAHN